MSTETLEVCRFGAKEVVVWMDTPDKILQRSYVSYYLHNREPLGVARDVNLSNLLTDRETRILVQSQHTPVIAKSPKFRLV